MKKYYNKEMPTHIHCVYGSRHSGKTYYEIKKLEERCNFLTKENYEWYKRYERLVNRINEAIDYTEHIDDFDIKDFRRKEILEILKGSVK